MVVEENKIKNHCGNLKAQETYLQFTISVRVVRIHVSVGMHYAIRYFIRVVMLVPTTTHWKEFSYIENCKPLYVLVEISLFTFSVTF